MTELAEQITVRKSPLDEIHERLGATMIEYDGLHVPALYGDQLFEYATVREGGAGLIDLSLRGRFLVSGSEAIQFLNGLVTNDMNTLDVGNWMPAAFPNVQGRLIASARVIRTHDDQTGKKACPTFLLDTEAVTHHRVLKTIERFTLAGDFRVVDVTMQTALLSLQGKKAAKRVGAVFGDTVAELPKNRVAQIQWQQKQLTIWRATHTGEDGFDLLVDAENAEALWGALIDNGVRPVGYNALEILRIEAGLARYGVDMDESNVVTETNLDDAVSYAKGCYVGQEIIARIKYRGHVAKKLSGLEFNQVGKVEDGATLKSMDNKEVGRITSTTYSPLLGRRIALGYLKYDYLNPETSVKTVSGEEEHPAHVTKLPFVHGSAP